MKKKKVEHTKRENISDNFSVMETAIDLSLQQEYVNISKTIDFDNIDYRELLAESKKLFFENIPIESKKKILIHLAHSGTAESYRTIEKYLKIGQQDLQNWTLLALTECRMFLESSLLENDGGLISTGLGGKDNKLRYYFIISSKNDLPFSKTQRNIIKNSFENISQKFISEIEEIIFRKNYGMLKVLIPMDIAVSEFIEEGIKDCNNKDDFVFFHYYVTNINKPTKNEILKYLQEIKYEKGKSMPTTNTS